MITINALSNSRAAVQPLIVVTGADDQLTVWELDTPL
jgi:hypothetical protein